MSGPTLTLTASGIATFTDENGRAGTVPELVQRLRLAGVAPDDIAAVLLLAGAVRSQARLLQRIDVLEPLARKSANFEAGRDIRNMGRGVGPAKKARVHALAKLHGPRYKSDRSLHEFIGKQPDVKLTREQVLGILKPKRNSR